MENLARTNPENVSNLVMLGGTLLQMQQTNRAMELFNQALDSTNLKYPDASAVAQFYGQLANISGFEKALRKLVVLAPDVPEHRYNLAAVESITGRTGEAMADLKLALDMNKKRLAANPAASDLMNTVRNDPNINNLRGLPEFQKLVPPTVKRPAVLPSPGLASCPHCPLPGVRASAIYTSSECLDVKKVMSNDNTEMPEAETNVNAAEAAAPPTPAQIADLKTRAAKADENWERLLRTTADFENFKKRAAREKIEAAQYANRLAVAKSAAGAG